ncbi:hypothetical protein HK098_004823 [Nowakowskiella sp. JEL0407]|nr:hypothetical protein HK098_004823 [Nowakowskiella sp. JEL0407]
MTAVKSGYEDYIRHLHDNKINQMETYVLSNWQNCNYPLRTSINFKSTNKLEVDLLLNGWEKIQWQELRDGDFVLLRKNELVPADIAVISTSEENGNLWVETKNLDGETNLKFRTTAAPTNHITLASHCKEFTGFFEVAQPNANMFSFNATLVLPPEVEVENASVNGKNERQHWVPPTMSSGNFPGSRTFPINVQNVLLRGSVLRNTEFAIGIVLNVGKATKVVINSGMTPLKKSRIDRLMNKKVIFNFVILGIISAITAINSSLITSGWNIKEVPWLGGVVENEHLHGFSTFWAACILFQNILPISLYITIDIIKTSLAFFIWQDFNMYDDETNQKCTAKTWSICDDLGQIQYVFSDKTGTLTQNKMQFRKCSINGVLYGDKNSHFYNDVEIETHQQIAEIYPNSQYKFDEMNTFNDSQIFRDYKQNPAQRQFIKDFLILLAVCHSVKAPEKEIINVTKSNHSSISRGKSSKNASAIASVKSAYDKALSCVEQNSDKIKLTYMAESPDEFALISGAASVGVIFCDRTKTSITVDFFGEAVQFEILHLLEFDSTRKRMSIIVKTLQGRILLLCKGADSAIYPRLTPGNESVKLTTFEHLETFGTEGFRTLCFAMKEIPSAEYEEWNQIYHNAITDILRREEKISSAVDLIENNLELVGATAIEDKLQERVPECIELLRLAGINVWVLTGDKMETSINVGFAANLLTREMNILTLKGCSNPDNPELAREKILHQMENAQKKYFGNIENHVDLSQVLEVDSISEKSNFLEITGKPMGNTKSFHSILKNSISSLNKISFPNSLSPAADFALVVDGAVLGLIMEKKELQKTFLELSNNCRSVICCRVSPKQKSQVVKLVKLGLGAMSLAIGDGANDVSMIQEADVGVGIYGKEGLQAAMASDYVISQFRFLESLVLIHGQSSYHRISETIMLFFGYIAADVLYDYTLIMFYNLVFTSLPPLVIGIFNQKIKGKFLLMAPQLYYQGIIQVQFTFKRFYIIIIDSIYQSAICYWGTSEIFKESGFPPQGDYSKDLFATILGMYVVTVVNAGFILTIRYWSWISTLLMLVSTAAIFVYILIASYISSLSLYGMAAVIFKQPLFWAGLLWILVTALLPRVVLLFIIGTYFPGDFDIMIERQHLGITERPTEIPYKTLSKSKNDSCIGSNSIIRQSDRELKTTQIVPTIHIDFHEDDDSNIMVSPVNITSGYTDTFPIIENHPETAAGDSDARLPKKDNIQNFLLENVDAENHLEGIVSANSRSRIRSDSVFNTDNNTTFSNFYHNQSKSVSQCDRRKSSASIIHLDNPSTKSSVTGFAFGMHDSAEEIQRANECDRDSGRDVLVDRLNDLSLKRGARRISTSGSRRSTMPSGQQILNNV